MQRRIRMIGVIGIVSVMLVTGCVTTTRMTGVWNDPSFAPGQIRSAMVVGVCKHETIRKLFEDEFVKQLKARNILAAASYTMFSLEELDTNKGAVEKTLQEKGFTSVIITRLIDKKTEHVYYPPTVTYFGPPDFYYGGWDYYYHTGYSFISSPGYTSTYDVVKLETNVYDVSTDKLLWSGLSESFFENAPETQLRSVAAAIINRLLK